MAGSYGNSLFNSQRSSPTFFLSNFLTHFFSAGCEQNLFLVLATEVPDEGLMPILLSGKLRLREME